MTEIFEQLKALLAKFEGKLSVVHDNDAHYYLNTASIGLSKKPDFFGSVQIKKKYVSFHLMPVYFFPELLNDLSPELKKRMQGKSCFNFIEIDLGLFNELGQLVEKAFDLYKNHQKV
jgi:hypothetical protein